MIDFPLKNLFTQDSISKEIIITFLDDTSRRYTNEDIVSEQYHLTESLCSQNSLKFGSCESSLVKFTILNDNKSWKDKWIKISLIINNVVNNPFQVGIFYVQEDTPSSDKYTRQITAYDRMFTLLTKNVRQWITDFWKDKKNCSLKEFRNAFCNSLGIKQVEQTLINDDILVNEDMTSDIITGQDILEDLGEINGVFTHFTRNDELTYITLALPNLYPSQELYPNTNVFPGHSNDTDTYEQITQDDYTECIYENFETSKCSGIIIQQSDEDVGVTVKQSDDNIYRIVNNIFARNKNSDELNIIASKLFNYVQNISYIPISQLSKIHSNLCIEIGDTIEINTNEGVITSFLLERNVSGIEGMSDTYTSKGELTYTDTVSDNSLSSNVEQLKNKTHNLTNNIDTLKSEISDKVSTSVFEQISNKIVLQVSKNGNVAALQLDGTGDSVDFKLSADNMEFISNDKLNLTTNDLSIVSKNFSVSSEGSVVCRDIDIQGGMINIGNSFNLSSDSGLSLQTKQFMLDDNNALFQGDIIAKTFSTKKWDATNAINKYGLVVDNVVYVPSEDVLQNVYKLKSGDETYNKTIAINNEDGGIFIPDTRNLKWIPYMDANTIKQVYADARPIYFYVDEEGNIEAPSGKFGGSLTAEHTEFIGLTCLYNKDFFIASTESGDIVIKFPENTIYQIPKFEATNLSCSTLRFIGTKPSWDSLIIDTNGYIQIGGINASAIDNYLKGLQVHTLTTDDHGIITGNSIKCEHLSSVSSPKIVVDKPLSMIGENYVGYNGYTNDPAIGIACGLKCDGNLAATTLYEDNEKLTDKYASITSFNKLKDTVDSKATVGFNANTISLGVRYPQMTSALVSAKCFTTVKDTTSGLWFVTFLETFNYPVIHEIYKGSDLNMTTDIVSGDHFKMNFSCGYGAVFASVTYLE